MKIHGVEVHRFKMIEGIYPRLNRFKLVLAQSLSLRGYSFMSNNTQGISETHKWESNRPKLIGSSKKRNPRYLWAVKPAGEL